MRLRSKGDKGTEKNKMNRAEKISGEQIRSKKKTGFQAGVSRDLITQVKHRRAHSTVLVRNLLAYT